MAIGVETGIDRRPVELAQNLIRFNTTNPPGNETECIRYIDLALKNAGLETTTAAKSPDRPNLFARIKGRGEAPGLLLQGHVDVVPTGDEQWSHPPFGGEIADGFLWGRGALDMKGGVAMMLAAFLRLQEDGEAPPGDVVFAALSDEENHSTYGARYIVEERPELLEGIQYAIGEFGGFSAYMASRKFYMIQVCEKQTCGARVTFRGKGGHSAVPEHNSALCKLGKALVALDRGKLPAHVVPSARLMFQTIARAMPFPEGMMLRQLGNATLAEGVLRFLGPTREAIEPMLHNTATPVYIHTAIHLNSIPEEATLLIHARLLPGYTPEDLKTELHGLLGMDEDIETFDYQPGPPQASMDLYPVLAGILHDMDPGGAPVPLLLSAVTDARYFSRLGIQAYGFIPMQLPEGMEFWRLTHGTDERIPVESLDFGSRAIYRLIKERR